MISLDTNVVVRLLTNDDPIQVGKAKKLLSSSDVFVTKSVLLETSWVLQYCYELSKKTIVSSLQKFISLANVDVEDILTVIQAINFAEQGVDFADALHLASSTHSDKLATFDKKFYTNAKKVHSYIRVYNL